MFATYNPDKDGQFQYLFLNISQKVQFFQTRHSNILNLILSQFNILSLTWIL